MRVLETVAAFREARRAHAVLGFAPTMGFLHDGHLSLVARARAENPAVAASLFVNPTQFGDARDLLLYPRDLPGDLAKLERAGVDLVFAPSAQEMYPPGAATRIEVGAIAEVLEGASRPGHFAGVATVVAKLFSIVAPTRAYFGRKDAQQVAVVRRMVVDLDLPVEIVACETVRDPDGLALSSRNARLSPAGRAVAPALHRALLRAQAAVAAGARDAEELRAAMREALAAEPLIALDYVSVADPDTLAELDRVDAPALASLAARIGDVRLIDNLPLTPKTP